MSADVERIAAVLSEHKTWEARPPHWQTVACSGCDWKTQVPMTEDAGMAHRNHVAEVLAAAGIGHVPTALHQAADALKVPGTLWHGDSGVSVMVDFANSQTIPLDQWLRDRADRIGDGNE